MPGFVLEISHRGKMVLGIRALTLVLFECRLEIVVVALEEVERRNNMHTDEL